MFALYSKLIKLSDMTLNPLLNLAIRVHMALIFWKSGVLKYESWQNDQWEDVVEAFTDYHPIPGVDPNLAAIGGTVGELVLPAMLALGLFTRIGAGGLLVMTLVIQYLVPADYGVANPQHYFWMLLLAVPMLQGGGILSVDGLFQKFMCKKCRQHKDVESAETTEEAA